MLPGGAAAVDGFAVAGPQHVDLAGVGEGLEGAVHGGQAHGVTAVLEHVVQLLGAAELVHLVQRRGHGGPLPSGSSSYWRGLARRSRHRFLLVSVLAHCARRPIGPN
ncbi:hypothetical protein GCM10020254_56340 [Streptomyces goshikiensis]